MLIIPEAEHGGMLIIPEAGIQGRKTILHNQGKQRYKIQKTLPQKNQQTNTHTNKIRQKRQSGVRKKEEKRKMRDRKIKYFKCLENRLSLD